ncbi:VCBS domain-containing protein, partial [Chromobacterium piscinae]
DYSGKLNVADADQGQSVFDTSRVDNKTSNLGTITIDANGNWHYSVDNAKVSTLRTAHPTTSPSSSPASMMPQPSPATTPAR